METARAAREPINLTKNSATESGQSRLGGVSNFLRQSSVLFVTLVFIGGLIAYDQYQEYQRIGRQERERLAALTGIVGKNIIPQLVLADRIITNVINDLPSWQKQNDGFKLANRQLKIINATINGIPPILVMDASGTVVASSDPNLLGRNFAYRDYFKTAVKNPDTKILQVSAPFQTVLNDFAFTLLRTTQGPSGEFSGIVVVTEVPAYFTNLLDSVRYAPDLRSAIVHGDGKLFLISPPQAGADGVDLAQPGSFFMRHLQSGNPSGVYTGTNYLKGDERMTALSTVRLVNPAMDKPLIVSVSREMNAVYEPWRKEALARGGYFGSLVMVCFFGLYFYNRRQRIFDSLVSGKEVQRWQAEEELRESYQAMRGTLETSLDGFWRLDGKGYLLDANPTYSEQSGYTREELLRMHVSDLESVETASDTADHIQRVMASGGDQFESRHRRKDGSEWQVEVSATYREVAGGQFFVFLRDISKRKQAEAKLQLAANVFGYAREGIIIANAQGIMIDVNEAFTRITGYGREEAIGQTPRFLSSGRHDKSFYFAMWSTLKRKGHWSGEIWNKRKDGEVFAELLTISAVRDAAGSVLQYVALFSDITALKEHQSQLEHFAHFDTLTNLPNRVLMADRLHQAMTQAQRRGKHLAVSYLDLDGFKAINDLHGHNTGDQVLVTLAQRMKLALREGDSLARLGGDEFVAVLVDLEDVSTCLPLLTRLLAAVAQPVQIGDLTLQASASVGVTFYPQRQDIDADQLLRQADQAMYQAKLAGKSRFQIFDTEQDSSVRGHHESLERIRLALEQSEFVLYYQPKVNMRTGEVIGAEALIRWQHPEKGLLLPAVFLPAIEDHPLAVAIGEWVIDTALTQVERWHTGGLNLHVSVNVGARQLQQSDFVERLRRILSNHPELRPGGLELEVLETSALEDIGQISEVIEACSQMGVTFALDDFGTGYSSLTYLKRLRVTLLKIDKSFVRDMLVDPDDLAILKGVIGLAAAFRREVIAEGVETAAHGNLLLELGCELAQGYGIARPMPAEQLPRWAAAWQADPTWIDGEEPLTFK